MTIPGSTTIRPAGPARPRRAPRFGPGALVAAAFIGPGTVTTCTVAGARFGPDLAWVLVLATLAAIVLQEMAARLGAGARLGLGEALMRLTPARPVRLALAGLVLLALGLGNAAYQAGNLTGGVLGVQALGGADGGAGGADGQGVRLAALAGLAGLAGAALWRGRCRQVERVLIGLVVVLALAYLGAFVLVRPDLAALARGLIPRVPPEPGAWLLAAALIGTTVVPYNLFLHAAAARRRFEGEGAVRAARRDTVASVGLGGFVSLVILAVAASALARGTPVASAADLARAVEPIYGEAARILLGIGLLAAGLTSAITAPMATGYAVAELVGGDEDRRLRTFRATALAVLGIGTVIAASGFRPVTLILVAQAANGLLLPILAGVLLFVMNARRLLGGHVNGPLPNAGGALVVLLASGLGVRALLRAFGLLP